jgi:hypothetical protein
MTLSALRSIRLRRALLPFGILLLASLAACNGSAVVTLTAIPSTDTYLAYRVGLTSVQLETSSGRTAGGVLPKATTVDLARLTNLADVVGTASLTAGNYDRALVTLDYSSAQIIYDNGTADGLPLTPLGANGQPLGQVTMLLYIDPSNQLSVVRGSSGHVSLAFNLAASNVVSVAQKTVTVMPMMVASALPIDSKVVHLRGPFSSVNGPSTGFTSGIVPFDFGNAGDGSLGVAVQSVTAFEINGTPSSGTAGITQMAALKAGTMVEAFGTLTTSDLSSNNSLFSNTGASTGTTDSCSDGSTPSTVNGVLTCTDGASLVASSASSGTTETCSSGATPTTVSGVLTCPDGSTLTFTSENTGTGSGVATTVNFSASEVLAGSSVQGSGLDRISGIVTGRSGNTLTVDDGTLLTNDGTNSLIDGTATVKIGSNTQVTQFGAASAQANGTQDISVGSLIYAFGTASAISSSSVTLDASAGRVRLGQTTASGIAAGSPSSSNVLTLTLATLGGRSAASFDFTGTGASASADASAAAYQVTAANLTLTNVTNGSPVEVTGMVSPFGAAPPALSATTLLDYTTIDAELVMDYGAGTPSPFASYSTTQIVLDARNGSAGTRHEIQTGAQTVNIVGIASDPIIVPNSSSANSVYTIGHAVSGTFENFNTYSAFIMQLELELNGTLLVTGVTAQGQYTSSTYTFSASNITIFLNN